MDNRFEKLFEYILLVEGGYFNHPNDKGGETNYGIIKSVARTHGYKGSMRDIPMSVVKEIYYKRYYLKNNIDKITNTRVALSIFDWCVNSGNYGVKKAQIVANKLGANLVVDGKLGSLTAKAINSLDPEQFLKQYHQSQRDFYHSIVRNRPSQKVFLKGWLNRVVRKENFIKSNL